jgi:hypothetical protein
VRCSPPPAGGTAGARRPPVAALTPAGSRRRDRPDRGQPAAESRRRPRQERRTKTSPLPGPGRSRLAGRCGRCGPAAGRPPGRPTGRHRVPGPRPRPRPGRPGWSPPSGRQRCSRSRRAGLASRQHGEPLPPGQCPGADRGIGTPARLPLHLMLAVALGAGLEGQRLGVPRELEGRQHVSNGHRLTGCRKLRHSTSGTMCVTQVPDQISQLPSAYGSALIRS